MTYSQWFHQENENVFTICDSLVLNLMYIGQNKLAKFVRSLSPKIIKIAN